MQRPARALLTILTGWLLLAAAIAGPAAGQDTPSPGATPVASPVAESGCGALGPFFLELATLVRNNEGLDLLRDAGFDVLVLTGDEAERVVASLDELIAALRAIVPPEPAATWHAAYIDQMVWYRSMAATRDPLDLQAIINDDRRLFGNLGRGLLAGQTACGYETWTDAWEAAFGD